MLVYTHDEVSSERPVGAGALRIGAHTLLAHEHVGTDAHNGGKLRNHSTAVTSSAVHHV